MAVAVVSKVLELLPSWWSIADLPFYKQLCKFFAHVVNKWNLIFIADNKHKKRPKLNYEEVYPNKPFKKAHKEKHDKPSLNEDVKLRIQELMQTIFVIASDLFRIESLKISRLVANVMQAYL